MLDAVSFTVLRSRLIGHLELLLDHGVAVNEVYEHSSSKLTARDAVFIACAGGVFATKHADILKMLSAAGPKC